MTLTLRVLEAAGADARLLARDAGRAVISDIDAALGSANEGPIDVIDFFSGCGGMSAGFAAVNGVVPAYRLLMADDVDATANESYRANFGIRPHALDAHDLSENPAELRSLVASAGRRPDAPLVLIGCAPCQGFSSHRNAAGEDDGRNNLFVDFASIAAMLQPDVVIAENVPELFSDRYWPIVTKAVGTLADAGYFVHLSAHNLAGFGVPQERFRALLIAAKRPIGPPAAYFEKASYRTVRDAIGSLPPIKPGLPDLSDPLHYTARHRLETVETIKAVPLNGGNRPPQVGPESLRRAAVKNGKPAYEDVYGRLHWDRPAVTITAHARNPASGRYVHPEQHRGLSVREAALLQGFPKNWTFAGSLGEQFRQIGNAVPPLFSAALAAHVLGELVSPAPPDELPTSITKPVGPSFSRLIPSLKTGRRSVSDIHAHAVAAG